VIALLHRWKLSTRLVASSLLLLLAIELAGFAALRKAIDRNAHAQLSERLAVAERVWGRLLDQRSKRLAQGATLLAADPVLKSALVSGRDDVIVATLARQGARIGAPVVALLDARFELRQVSVAGRAAERAAFTTLSTLAPWLVERGSAVTGIGERPYQFVVVPVAGASLGGWVAMGLPLDRALVDELHAVSGIHATLRAEGDAPRLLHTSHDTVTVGPPWLTRRVAVAESVALELSGSLDEAVAPYRALEWTLAAIGIAGLLLFAAGGLWSARRVTRPLAALVGATTRLGLGEYETPLEVPAEDDEVGELARALEHMRGNIALQQREIRQLAYWDRLTGLPNRVQFRRALATAIGACNPARNTLAVLTLDLDRFKPVNELLGYACGDRLLRGVAARLSGVVREGDLVARLAGDEFALLLLRSDAGAALDMAARIGQAFEIPLAIDDQAVDLSASVGIACWPAHGADADTLLSHAEAAMGAAKRAGTGAQLYDAALDVTGESTLTLLSELRRALDEGELRIFLQPKVRIADGALAGAEALMRWQHPQRGLLAPQSFIPFAERTGFIRRLTLWLIEEVARHQPALAAVGVPRIAVNLSARDLLDVELADKLDALLARHRASAPGLCLEITESAMMDDPERARATLTRLAARGFRLAVDDFGTGYSSLGYLKLLPVHELKIDKSFVGAMVREPRDARIVRCAVELAHGLGLSVVAEGVESASIFGALAAFSCDEAQGWHLGHPLPIDQFVRWAAARATGAEAQLSEDGAAHA
jgi:diguanylate cyclase (GGDEF)-like protein